MTVGELFINIGITGANKVGESLVGVSKGMSDVMNTSLQTKASILGVIYGLERFMSTSAQLGMNLQQFSNYTGQSSEYLQRLAVDGTKAGLSLQEVEGSVVGVQKAIANMKMTGDTQGLGAIAKYTGGLDQTRINDQRYIIEKMRQFTQNKQIPIDIQNWFMRQTGMSDKFVGYLRTSQDDGVDKVSKRLILQEKEQKKLSEIEVAWKMMGLRIQRTFDHLTAGHGLSIVNDIEKMSTAILGVVNNVVKLIDHMKLFKEVTIAAGIAMTGSFSPVIAAVSSILYLLSKVEEFREGKLEGAQKRLDATGGISGTLDRLKNHKMDIFESTLSDLLKTFGMQPATAGGGNAAPVVTQNFTITNYGDAAKDSKVIKDTHARAGQESARGYSKALRTSPSTLRGG